MTTAADCLAYLLRAQNRDGGWGLQPAGMSWTESTAFALLALYSARQSSTPAAAKGLEWLRSVRREDGGWSPCVVVRESTWVTALAVLVLHRYGALNRSDPAFSWILASTGAESTMASRVRRWLLSGQSDEGRARGWPWVPGAAAWVAPTALTIVAVRQTSALVPHLGFAERLTSAREFLLSRRCADGGWNHGSSQALGYHGDSYAETSGMALLALPDDPSQLTQSHQRAIALLQNCRSIEGWSWLQMGLRAQKLNPSVAVEPAVRLRDPREVAIYLLALQALQGNDPWGQS